MLAEGSEGRGQVKRSHDEVAPFENSYHSPQVIDGPIEEEEDIEEEPERAVKHPKSSMLRPIIKHPPSDQFWRKYAQKRLKTAGDDRNNVVRYYYRCTVQDCPAKKTVEKEPWDLLEQAQLRYSGSHNHPITHPSQEISPGVSGAAKMPQQQQDDFGERERPDAHPMQEKRFADEIQNVITASLETICVTLSWPMCQLWIPDFQKSSLSLFKCNLPVNDVAKRMFQDQFLSHILPLAPAQPHANLPNQVWQTQQPQLYQELTSNMVICPICRAAQQEGHRSAAAFPVALDGQLVGVVTMFSPNEVCLNDADVTFLINALNTMELGLVAVYSRLVEQAPAEVKRLLPPLVHYTNAICKAPAMQAAGVARGVIAGLTGGNPMGGVRAEVAQQFVPFSPFGHGFVPGMNGGMPLGGFPGGAGQLPQ